LRVRIFSQSKSPPFYSHFVIGSAVYLSVQRAPTAGHYIVSYLNASLTLDGFIVSATDADSCGFTWSKMGLGDGVHSVLVQVGKDGSGGNKTFEIDNFMYVTVSFSSFLILRKGGVMELNRLIGSPHIASSSQTLPRT
jgi:hypothetical protein